MYKKASKQIFSLFIFFDSGSKKNTVMSGSVLDLRMYYSLERKNIPALS